MLVMMTADIAKPEGCSNKEFFEVWRKESVAAQAAAVEGVLSEVFGKSPGSTRSLPLWKLPTEKQLTK